MHHASNSRFAPIPICSIQMLTATMHTVRSFGVGVGADVLQIRCAPPSRAPAPNASVPSRCVGVPSAQSFPGFTIQVGNYRGHVRYRSNRSTRIAVLTLTTNVSNANTCISHIDINPASSSRTRNLDGRVYEAAPCSHMYIVWLSCHHYTVWCIHSLARNATYDMIVSPFCAPVYQESLVTNQD